jgi:hypothetical protein
MNRALPGVNSKPRRFDFPVRESWYLQMRTFVLLCLLLAAGCNRGRHDIAYQVTGNVGHVWVDYSDECDTMARAIDCGLPWSYQFQCDETRRHLFVSAMSHYYRGTIAVSIVLDGKVLKTSTVTGMIAGATTDTVWP